MNPLKNQKFSNWAGISVPASRAFLPDNESHIKEIFDMNQTVSIRGLGKNYTDAGLNQNNVLLNHSLKQIQEFDEKTGIVRVQSGVTLHDLLLWAIPQNWLVPTIPGTAHVTIGGMIASNVHGKNQFRVGSIGDYVQSITLHTPGFGKIQCSPTENREIFDATVGGMGTTGFIESVDLRLVELKSANLRSSYRKTRTITDMIDFMESKRNICDYTIGWIAQDTLKGNQINAMVEYANYTDENITERWNLKKPLRTSFNVPFTFPVCPVNAFTIPIFNSLVYRKVYPSDALIHLYDFNFKLDKVKNWNRIYGKNGFIQYQCLIPKSARTAEFVQHVMQFLTDHDVLSSLVVVKMHKKDKSGYLSFSQDGISIAMDFPYTPYTVSVLRKLTPWVMEIGGRLYLTKDRTMNYEQFHEMYRLEIRKQRNVLSKVDPRKLMQSELTKRLKIHHE